MPTLKKSRPVFCDGAALAGNGADNGVRTRDPHLGKVVLYQLSHVRIAWNILLESFEVRKALFSCRLKDPEHPTADEKMVGGTRFELVTPTVSR